MVEIVKDAKKVLMLNKKFLSALFFYAYLRKMHRTKEKWPLEFIFVNVRLGYFGPTLVHALLKADLDVRLFGAVHFLSLHVAFIEFFMKFGVHRDVDVGW